MVEERRVVTVLFADVAGSTTLGEQADPEEVRALLGRYYTIAKKVVEDHGGTVEKFIGDAVMAVFGVPHAYGDDAERTLLAALALRRELVSDPVTADLTLRMGANTGEVVAARGGGADFLVTGDAVNVAARLQQTAEPGTILVGERTIAAVGPRFRFGPTAPLGVKGKREPVEAAPLLGRTPSAELAAAPGPFIGRVGDLAQLELLAGRAVNEGRPQLVTITAPAGTGKTRLVEEFLRRLPDLAPGAAVALAQCLPYGAAVTYLPLRAVISGLLGVEFDRLELRHVEGALAAAGYGPADSSRIASLVGATVGKESAIGVEGRERVAFFGAWRILIEAVASRRPLVLVFEDLQWASDSLLDLVEHVTLPRTRAALFMIALARPELLDRRPQWGARHRNFTALSLDPLAPDETRALVDALIPRATARLRARITEIAEGNPFFAGELARAYGERLVGQASEDVALPDTVQATVLARLDQLPELEREILQAGAVAGRTFPLLAVTSLLPDRPPPELVEGAEALVDRELITPQGPDAYSFRHIFIREVAYATLPRSRRLRSHVELARWFEARAEGGASDVPELVAYHYRQAMSLAPPGRSLEEVGAARAMAAFERAAAFAKNTGADRESAAHLRSAIAIAPPSDQIRLYERLGDVLEIADDAIAAYREAYDRWSTSPEGARDALDGARLLRKRLLIHVRWSGSLTLRLSPTEFEGLLAQARSHLARHPDPVEEARLRLVEAFGAWRWESADSLSRYIPLARAAREALSSAGDVAGESEALDAVASLARFTGDLTAATAADRERLKLGDRLALLERSDAWAMLCWDLTYLGRYEEVLDAFAEYRRHLRPGEPEGFYPFAHVWSILAARTAGRWDDALKICDQLGAFWESGERGAQAPVAMRGWLSGIDVAEARMDAARVARYRAIAEGLLDLAALPPDDPGALTVRAQLHHDLDAARQALTERTVLSTSKAEILAALLFDHDATPDQERLAAIEANAQPMVPLLRERLRLARALREGPDTLAETIRALDAASMRADAARASVLLAQMTLDPAVVADARRRLEALGDRAYLARLDELR